MLYLKPCSSLKPIRFLATLEMTGCPGLWLEVAAAPPPPPPPNSLIAGHSERSEESLFNATPQFFNCLSWVTQ